jgi:hypothetical protein
MVTVSIIPSAVSHFTHSPCAMPSCGYRLHSNAKLSIASLNPAFPSAAAAAQLPNTVSVVTPLTSKPIADRPLILRLPVEQLDKTPRDLLAHTEYHLRLIATRHIYLAEHVVKQLHKFTSRHQLLLS